MNMLKQDPENKTCVCKAKTGLFIPNRQLSLVTAASILTAFITFMTGYFIGQHSAVESFTSKIEQESFADQIYASLFTPGVAKELAEQDDNQEEYALDIAEEKSDAPQLDKSEAVVQSESESEQINNQDDSVSLLPQETYCAQLIGFGTERAAQKFAERLAIKNIPVIVKKRQSKTAKGKMVSWYQVVTQAYNDKEKLRELVDRIEKTEKIKGAQIISC